MFVSSLFALVGVTAVAFASPSPIKRADGPVQGNFVRVQWWINAATYHLEDIEVKESSAELNILQSQTALNAKIIDIPDGLGHVQCNAEIDNGQYNYPGIPAFDDHFVLTFDEPQKLTGIKCYKI